MQKPIYTFLFFLLIFSVKINAQPTVGLFKNTPGSFNGYTLFGNNENTYLIDNCGFQVHRWESDFAPGAAQYLLADGNLLRTGKINGNFGSIGTGGRFEILDWNSNVIWSMDFFDDNFHPHHDIEPLPNGNFLALIWEKHSASEAVAAGRTHTGEVWTEKIIEVKPEGINDFEIVWEWRTWDHLIQDTDSGKPNFGVVSEHPELMDFNYVHPDHDPFENWLHANAVSYNPDLDQIAISNRKTSEIWVIDHSTTTAEAAGHTGGKSGKGGDILYRFGNPAAYGRGTLNNQIFSGQHDIRWIPAGFPNEGKMMVFNNNFSPGRSSVEIWAPPINSNGEYTVEPEMPFGPEGIDRHYEMPGFHSNIMSGAQPLSNGNLLICEAEGGRFFEIDKTDEIVWDYINPVNRNGSPVAQGGTPRFNEVFRCIRYPVDYSGFEGKDLTPTVPVEINPDPTDCEIYESSSLIFETAFAEKIRILGNSIFEQIEIENLTAATNLKGGVYDFSGRKLKSIEMMPGKNQFDISYFPKGIYFIKIEGSPVSLKFLKS